MTIVEPSNQHLIGVFCVVKSALDNPAIHENKPFVAWHECGYVSEINGSDCVMVIARYFDDAETHEWFNTWFDSITTIGRWGLSGECVSNGGYDQSLYLQLMPNEPDQIDQDGNIISWKRPAQCKQIHAFSCWKNPLQF
jgi:hypothetical protein